MAAQKDRLTEQKSQDHAVADRDRRDPERPDGHRYSAGEPPGGLCSGLQPDGDLWDALTGIKRCRRAQIDTNWHKKNGTTRLIVPLLYPDVSSQLAGERSLQ
jgi:hypothetical protein